MEVKHIQITVLIRYLQFLSDRYEFAIVEVAFGFDVV
jgi:dethiobiotin synthetase